MGKQKEVKKLRLKKRSGIFSQEIIKKNLIREVFFK